MKIAQQETAVAAFYERVPAVAPTQVTRLLSAIQAGSDYSMCELRQLTNIDKSAISARLFALRESGVLEYGPERKCRISGVTINPVRKVPV